MRIAIVAICAAFVSFGFVQNASAQSSTVRAQAQYVQKDRLEFCHGFGCHFVTNVSLKGDPLEELTEIMDAGKQSPAHEREALKQAVAYFERHAATIAGTENDIAGNYTQEGDRTQLDCVDEARNTTRLLIFLRKHDLLRHHSIGRIEGRGFVLDTRYPHNTAVVVEKETGIRWSIDSWMRHNGDVPEVMTLSRWKSEGFS